MSGLVDRLKHLIPAEPQVDRVVPPSGTTAWLTFSSAAAMAFLAVFALALCVATGRLSDRWSAALAQNATIRISAPASELAAETAAVLRVLSETPGIASARAIAPDEMQGLLAPWLGPDLPVDSLPLPQLIDLTETDAGFDAEGLRLRLSAEAPAAILDDHTRWRRPMVQAADRIRALGLFALILIGAATAAMVTLAARAALATNSQVIRVLRLVGARDTYIARAFVRRFTLRTLFGALAGTLTGMCAIALMPSTSETGGFLSGLGFTGAGWFAPLAIPPLAAIVAFAATRAAALRSLREVQ
ncbi:MAG: FtsX-like permease family protein [Albidovulum sp.]|uniref:cell division protein FtsX n=1 Tax=Albidovulum sp. TaxID=1872424 RepID=UPI003C9D1587